MNIAIIHYHLNRGGVAQVVKSHLRAMDLFSPAARPERVLLVYGGRREGWFDPPAGQREPVDSSLHEIVIPELDYDEGVSAKACPAVLADRIENALREFGCLADSTLLHFHNHSLGKNVSLPGAIHELAQRGFPMLLQIHDFAEDLRPANYCHLRESLLPDEAEHLPDLLYPQAAHIHYAVLNGRDLSVFRKAGIDEQRLHLLPNPVSAPGPLPDRASARQRVAERLGIGVDERYVLYPVRGIRRKNLGEALLRALVNHEVAFGFTLPPLNPREQPGYIKWRTLASELNLRCCFETGGDGGVSLTDNIAACDRVLTTSLAEGFGLVFLESALSHRPLIGRDLPEITGNFVQHGMTFSGLQPRVDVPVEWLGRGALQDMLARSYNATLQSYRRAPLSQERLQANLDGKMPNGRIDFGDLDAEGQVRVIRKVHGSVDAMERLVKLNPFLRDGIHSCDEGCFDEVERNADAVMKWYSLDAAARQLEETYRQLITGPRGPFVALPSGGRILDSFLDFSRFRPVLI